MIIAIPTNNSGDKVPQRSQNAAYSEYVSNAGFTPILVPPEAAPEEIAEIADGLLLAGGVDIDPLYYGVSNSSSFYVDPVKDAHERGLLHAFRDLGRPIFGICRGLQLMFREFIHAHNEELGDYLEYVENINGHSQTNDLNVRRDIATHFVRTNPSSLFTDGDDTTIKSYPVNSMHHQAATINYVRATVDFGHVALPDIDWKEPSMLRFNDFELVAWSLRGITQPTANKQRDIINYWAVIEAMKIHNWGAPMMGVQWHPEELKDVRIIRNFFNNAVEGNLFGNVIEPTLIGV